MSRIGKNPVAIPAGVAVELAGQMLTAKGRLGTLSLLVGNEVTATIADGAVTIAPNSETKHARAMWGTVRALVNNMVTGVATGFTRNLDINGVGYRAAVQGDTLTCSSATATRSPIRSRRMCGSPASGRPRSP